MHMHSAGDRSHKVEISGQALTISHSRRQEHISCKVMLQQRQAARLEKREHHRAADDDLVVLAAEVRPEGLDGVAVVGPRP